MGHWCYLQIQIVFESRLHRTQTKESPGLRVQKQMDYQIPSFLPKEKHETENQALEDFGFLIEHDCFPDWVVKE